MSMKLSSYSNASRNQLCAKTAIETTVNKRKAKFLIDYVKSCNSLCSLFSHVADTEFKK